MTTTYAFPLTIRQLGYTAWASADSEKEARKRYLEAINRLGPRVRIIDQEGNDVTDAVMERAE